MWALLGFPSSAALPVLAQTGSSAEGQRTTGEEMGCLLNSTISWLVLTATLAKAVKNSLRGINLGLP